MSRADIFRIVDVLADTNNRTELVEVVERDAEEADVDEQVTVWQSTTHSPEMVVRVHEPLISLELINLPATLDARLVMLREPASEKARTYRLLRHRLLSRGDPRVIAVTSARPGDGKTTCAVNLALAIAEDTMMRVLLMDTNLRRPGLGRMFGFEPDESLVSNLARFVDVRPPYPVVGICGTRVHVAALPEVADFSSRLERTLFSVALAELRTEYDYIVVDAGSVLESADADVLGECADGVVVAARAGTSKKADLRRAIDQLRPAAVLGTVLLDA